LFSLLSGNSWFQVPYAEMSQVAICPQSGQRATSLCEKPDTIWIAQTGLQTLPCSYHKKIFLSLDKKYRVHSVCEPVSKMMNVPWFVLPPIQEFYFKTKNFGYHPLPPWRKDCANTNNVATMDLIYPKPNSKVFIPYELDGSAGSTLFEAAHRNPSATIFWHLDNKFIAATHQSHKLPFHPEQGNHTLLLIDDAGESMSRPFTVISTKK
jgi:penicillin-binding protein 1C